MTGYRSYEHRCWGMLLDQRHEQVPAVKIGDGCQYIVIISPLPSHYPPPIWALRKKEESRSLEPGRVRLAQALSANCPLAAFKLEDCPSGAGAIAMCWQPVSDLLSRGLARLFEGSPKTLVQQEACQGSFQ